jgi:hypothetical protein
VWFVPVEAPPKPAPSCTAYHCNSITGIILGQVGRFRRFKKGSLARCTLLFPVVLSFFSTPKIPPGSFSV